MEQTYQKGTKPNPWLPNVHNFYVLYNDARRMTSLKAYKIKLAQNCQKEVATNDKRLTNSPVIVGMVDFLGKVALLLANLENKVKQGEMGDKYIVVLPTTFFLIKEVLKRNNEYRMNVKYYNLEAGTPGREMQ
ncbi:hypothetical protein GOP47_0014920 [Adiantum capillus-veneris]|uniref:Uncharacterized protein n=1 Tax=Adiantum capillus-veneris TaxID=13818 RepID=A0A9D4UMY4_ADICA|nr:hypothetical protein GOP47_0014920 [Adiantum capillus-veneris]